MEAIHKKVLRTKMPVIVHQISDPHILAECMVVLTPQDKEQIKRKTTNYGPMQGVIELVSRLMRRGSEAFNCFLELLDDQDYEDLATEIRNGVDAEMSMSTPHSSSLTLDEGPITDGGEGTSNSTWFL